MKAWIENVPEPRARTLITEGEGCHREATLGDVATWFFEQESVSKDTFFRLIDRAPSFDAVIEWCCIQSQISPETLQALQNKVFPRARRTEELWRDALQKNQGLHSTLQRLADITGFVGVIEHGGDNSKLIEHVRMLQKGSLR